MTDPGESGTDPRQLLDQVLSDPFGDHVGEWYQHLIDQYPLWSFQAKDYARFHGHIELPTTYPLRLLMRSIVEDEERAPGRYVQGDPRRLPIQSATQIASQDQNSPAESQSDVVREIEVSSRLLAPLSVSLDTRRRTMAENTVAGASWTLSDPQSSSIFFPAVVADPNPHEPEAVPGHQLSGYELLGRELAEYVEDKVFAVDTTERNRAQERLDIFLEDIQEKLAANRPEEGSPKHLLREMGRQGRLLISACWDIFPFTLSDTARSTLEARGLSESEAGHWSARLALPILSHPEILALKAQSDEAARRRRGMGQYPTPPRFVIWLMADRLDSQAPSLSRTVFPSQDAGYFTGRENPVAAQRQALPSQPNT